MEQNQISSSPASPRLPSSPARPFEKLRSSFRHGHHPNGNARIFSSPDSDGAASGSEQKSCLSETDNAKVSVHIPSPASSPDRAPPFGNRARPPRYRCPSPRESQILLPSAARPETTLESPQRTAARP